MPMLGRYLFIMLGIDVAFANRAHDLRPPGSVVRQGRDMCCTCNCRKFEHFFEFFECLVTRLPPYHSLAVTWTAVRLSKTTTYHDTKFQNPRRDQACQHEACKSGCAMVSSSFFTCSNKKREESGWKKVTSCSPRPSLRQCHHPVTPRRQCYWPAAQLPCVAGSTPCSASLSIGPVHAQ